MREILDIELKIKTMKADPTYLFIKRNLNHLETIRFGSSVVSIPSPDDPELILNFKYNSPEFRKTISRYKERRAEFELQMDTLFVLKADLQKQLFN